MSALALIPAGEPCVYWQWAGHTPGQKPASDDWRAASVSPVDWPLCPACRGSIFGRLEAGDAAAAQESACSRD